jgi:hypothetical protein
LGSPEQLEAFIAGDPGLAANRGRIVPRNASRWPWTDTLDFRAAVNVPWGRRKVELTLDVLNVLNLIDSDKGRFTFTSNQNIAPIQYGGPTFNRFTTDDLRSRWQAQVGLRLRF